MMRGFDRLGGYADYGYSRMMGNYGWGGILMGCIMMILFIVLIVMVIRMLVRRGHYHGGPYMGYHNNAPAGSDSALEIVKLRYAKGEITKEEFDRLKNDLLA